MFKRVLGLALGSFALLLSAGQPVSAAPPINCEINVTCVDPSNHEGLAMARSQCRQLATTVGTPETYEIGVLLAAALVDMGAGPPLAENVPVPVCPGLPPIGVTCLKPDVEEVYACVGINQQ